MNQFNYKSSRSYKTNITGYLPIDIIDKLSRLAKDKDISRNTLFEEAIVEYLNRNKLNERL